MFTCSRDASVHSNSEAEALWSLQHKILLLKQNSWWQLEQETKGWQIKENIKAPRHCPLCGVPGEFPAQMASNAENVSIWRRHHGRTERGVARWRMASVGNPYIWVGISPVTLSSVPELALLSWHYGNVGTLGKRRPGDSWREPMLLG